MKIPVPAFALAIVIAAFLAGQAPPAKELSHFDPKIGSREGAGTASMGSTGAETKWASRITVQRILGGHLVQEDIRVDLEGMPAPLVFRAIYGFDSRTGNSTQLSLGNTGEFWIASAKRS